MSQGTVGWVDVEGDNDDNSVVSRQPSEVEFVEVEVVVVIVVVVVTEAALEQWVASKNRRAIFAFVPVVMR